MDQRNPIIEHVCPSCQSTDISICDNECGTFTCCQCVTEFYYDDNNQVIQGHVDTCGSDMD